MRVFLLTCLPLMLLSGCANWFAATAVDGQTLCRRIAPGVTAHLSALLADGGPRSQRTGLDLVTDIDAGCGWGR
jgi:hypothetical protein